MQQYQKIELRPSYVPQKGLLCIFGVSYILASFNYDLLLNINVDQGRLLFLKYNSF